MKERRCPKTSCVVSANRFGARTLEEGAARPDDIAAVIAFLASDDARLVTGGVSASSGRQPYA
ncbi:hypothetical protein BTHE68_72510 (plasmid) [Burkholderia sp. THE68]|nr:hypothetical protein BTHE68_72510 [Burkholderia sp. THE68]